MAGASAATFTMFADTIGFPAFSSQHPDFSGSFSSSSNSSASRVMGLSRVTHHMFL